MKNNLMCRQHNTTQHNTNNLNFTNKIFFNGIFLNCSISSLHIFLCIKNLIKSALLNKPYIKTNFNINNNFLRNCIINKKNIITFIILLTISLIFTGYSTVSTASTIPQSLQLSGNDIIAGEILTAEMPYSDDPTLKEQLIAEALKNTNYDFLIMPRYEIVKAGFSNKMRVIGRGVRVK